MIDTASHPLANYLRLGSIVVLAGCLLALLERRYRLLSRFLGRESTALNLAMTRIAVVVALFFEIDIQKIATFAQLDGALLVPPKGWAWVAAFFPRSVEMVHAVYAVFVVSGVMALIGLFGRRALLCTAAASFYLLTIPQLFGKIDHYHHLVIFSLLLAMFPSCDTLSVDAMRVAFRSADNGVIPKPGASNVYAAGLNSILIPMGLMYFFPGAWKVAGSWPHWFSSQNMEYVLYKRMLELQPTALQMAVVKMPLAMLLSTYAAVGFELAMLFLILWEQARPGAIALGLTFHNLTRLLMSIPFVALQFCYAALIDWTGLFRWLARLMKLSPITVIFDPHCRLCRRTIALLSNLDWMDLLKMHPNTELEELKIQVDVSPVTQPTGPAFAVVSRGGQLALGYNAYRVIASRVVFFWPVRLLMGLQWVNHLGSAIYGGVALSRTCDIHSRTAEIRQAERPGSVWPAAKGFAASIVCIMFVLGLAHGVNCWPLACYPTFDGPFTLVIKKLTLETASADGQVAKYTLSYDSKMGDLLGTGRWDGLVQHQLRGKDVTRASSAALARLWLEAHGMSRTQYAVLSVDHYVLDLDAVSLKYLGHEQFERLSAQDGL